MAGLFLDTRKINFRPLSDIAKPMYSSCHFLTNRPHESVPENERIEFRTDDPSPSTYPDEPYLFSTTKARYFYRKRYFWLEETYSEDSFSIYTCVMKAYAVKSAHFSFSETPLDYVIIIMCKGSFVAGLYRENKLVDTIELYNRTEPLSSKEEKSFHIEVKNAMNKWDAEKLPKFIRCRRDDFHLFGHNEVGSRAFNLTLHYHIPFATNYPSIGEIKNVNKKLFSCIKYKTFEDCEKAEERAKRKPISQLKTSPTKLSSTRDRKEPKNSYCTEARQAKELILKNDEDGLANLLKELETKAYFGDFISANHPEMDHLSLLHFAVLKDKVEAAKVLLEFGCNPSVYDTEGKTLYELSKTEDMRVVFIKAREEDENDPRWLRSKVPTADEFEKIPTPKPKYDPRPARDAGKNKRKEKLSKKKIHADDY